MRFLALGDSYTMGEGVAPDECWPSRLAALLRAEGVPIRMPEIVAQDGWTTDELRAGLAEADPQGPYDLVSLLTGVNDQYRGRAPEGYREAFARMLERAVALAGGQARRVFVVSIPDWGVTPFAEGRDRRQIAQEIDAFNAINRTEAERRGIAYVDVTPFSRKFGGQRAYVASDGLHPSGRQYAEWARLALPVARLALRLPS